MATSFDFGNGQRTITAYFAGSVDVVRSSLLPGFLAALDGMNVLEPLASVRLFAGQAPGELVYRVTTKGGSIIRYNVFPQPDGSLRFTITTQGTLWHPDHVALNTALRQHVMAMVQRHGLQTLEVEYL